MIDILLSFDTVLFWLIGCASAKKSSQKSENTDTGCLENWKKHFGVGRSVSPGCLLGGKFLTFPATYKSDVSRKPGQRYVGHRLLPMRHAPLLHVGDGSKGTAGPLQFGTSDIAGVARMRLSTTTNCVRDSNSGFFLEIYSWSHSQRRVTARQQW